MKWGWLFVPLLALGSSCVCLAQSSVQAPDPIQIAVGHARSEGRIVDAEKLLTDAIHELEQNDPQNPKLATYLKTLSQFVGGRGRHAEAMALIKRAYEIERNAYGPSDLRNTGDLVNSAWDAQAAGNNQEAEHLLNRALEIVRSNMANLRSAVDVGQAAAVLDHLSYLYITEHRWFDAEPLLHEEAKLCDFLKEPYRSGYGGCGGLGARLAEVYRGEGRTVDAEHVPPDEFLPAELAALNRIAEKYAKDGLYPSAEDTYSRAIALAEKMEADPKNLYGGLVVMEMNSLGQLLEKEGFKDRAERAYMSALEINEKWANPGLGHPGDPRMLNPGLLLNLYRSERRLKDAEPLLQRVLGIQEKSLGERHRAVIQTLTTLAGVYEEEGKNDEAKYAQALPLYERALALQETNLGPDHPQLVDALTHYAGILRKLHNDAKAVQVQARIDMISKAQQNERK